MLVSFLEYLGEFLAVTAIANLLIATLTIGWVLSIKKDATSAIAWCLTVLLFPFGGALLFLVFGYQRVYRPLVRKRKHRQRFHRPPRAESGDSMHFASQWAAMARLAERLDAFPPTFGNRVEFFHEGVAAFDAKLAAIRAARHHVHLEYFIVQPDETGKALFAALAEAAARGVEVRLLYDAMGSYRLTGRLVRTLLSAGGKCEPFLPLLNPLRRRTQVNMRNHRKILVVDGAVGFTGGMNIGDEYLGRVKSFGFWRDTDLRLEGPAVGDLQRMFVEDWDFASGEAVAGPAYFPAVEPAGQVPVQVVQSGPDQMLRSIREIYFAAIMRARKRLWIATPYFVPDAGLRDALCLAAMSGVDVRLLGLSRPDKWLPFLAGRYYWTDVLAAGVKVYQYTRGMMHAKLMLVDGQWASCGTANLDNRSMYLNFELTCLLYDPKIVAELERVFEADLADSVELDYRSYRRRPLLTRSVENFCRLFSPIL